jgi:hypothetical protein
LGAFLHSLCMHTISHIEEPADRPGQPSQTCSVPVLYTHTHTHTRDERTLTDDSGSTAGHLIIYDMVCTTH